MYFLGEEPKPKTLQHMFYGVWVLKRGGREAWCEPYSEWTLELRTHHCTGSFSVPNPVSHLGEAGSGNTQDKSSPSELMEAGYELSAVLVSGLSHDG